MKKQKIVGLDIGATKIHIGVVQDNAVIDEIKFPTPTELPKEQIIDQIIYHIEKLAGTDFTGIGIGVPGLVDEEQGIVYDLWNIPSWKEVFLKKQMEAHFNKSVFITNDANTFALGEKIYGKGKDFRNFVGITLGTGFGTGIIINNKLYSGILSSAGEMADIPYRDLTIEDYCSGKFFLRQAGMDGNQAYALAKKGDAASLKLFEEYGEHLGNAVKLILNILSPEAIFLGGSVSQSYEFFKSSLKERIQTFPFKRVLNKFTIAPSETLNLPILGAAALIKMSQSEVTDVPENFL